MNAVDDRPTWQLLLEAARRLADAGVHDFSRRELIEYVQSVDPRRLRSSIDPIIQGMTANAPGGPVSACGEAFRRVDRGRYVLLEHDPNMPSGSLAPVQSRRSVRMTSAKRARIQERLIALGQGFDTFVAAYDAAVPFVRSGQYESHRAAIDRRRQYTTVRAALLDDTFVALLYETSQRWGVGKRASRLVGESDFREVLRVEAPALDLLGACILEELEAEAGAIGAQVWELVENLSIVNNVARIVAGTKTLHHLLPDLVPPMDRAWTGRFFEWTPVDLQAKRRQTFLAAWRDLAQVATSVRPSRLVGNGWRTSSTKVLDNAVVAYTMR